MNNFLLKISHKDAPSIDQVGGKAFTLFELSKEKMPIPQGFVVTTQAYDLFLRENILTEKIKKIFIVLNKDSQREIIQLREKIENGIMPKKLNQEIGLYINKLDIRHCAVRSSATVEDGKNRSWAGEFESYLNIPPQDIETFIKKCWASMFNNRVIDYIGNFSEMLSMKMAVIIQEVIDSDVSGICFTRNPLNIKDRNLLIESVFGLGEMLAQGEVTPDCYIVERNTGIILEINVNNQKSAYRVDKNFGTKLINLKETFKQKLSGKEILWLVALALKIEKNKRNGCDIEWCKKDDNFFILQSRSITTGK